MLKSAKFTEHHFFDVRIFQLAQLFLSRLKIELSGNDQTKYSTLNSTKKGMRIFFENVVLENINKEYVNTKFVENSRLWKHTRQHLIWQFIFFLKDEGKLCDEWNQLENVRKKLCSNIKSICTSKILSAYDSSRFFVMAKQNETYTFYLDSSSLEIQTIMKEFITQQNSIFWEDSYFVSSLFETAGICPISIEDINYEVFSLQVKALIGKNKQKQYLVQLLKFYYFIYVNYNSALFSESFECDPRILVRFGLASEIRKGYSFIFYNPMEQSPKQDRWLLDFYHYKELQIKNMTQSIGLDFLKVKSGEYREYLKKYMWCSTHSIPMKTHNFPVLIYFLNYISDIKSGKILTIFARTTDSARFDVSEIAAYRYFILGKYKNITSQAHLFSAVKSLLLYLCDNKYIDFNKAIFEQLKIKMATTSDKKTIPDESLVRIAEIMKNRVSDSPKNAMYYSIFYLGLETEFRFNQLRNLCVDCVCETAKKGQYVILNQTKTSCGEKKEQAITVYTKKQLDEIRIITESYRNGCPDKSLKRLLFIELVNEKNNVYRPLSLYGFDKYFKDCSKEAGTDNFCFSNLRDTHMTKADEFIIRKGISEMYLRVLTDHLSPNTTFRNYIELDLRKMLEALNGVIIGNIRLKGKVKADDLALQETDCVLDECGYCELSGCIEYSFISCLLCQYFFTMPMRLQFFEEEIRRTSREICMSNNIHDKEDLIAIKRLLVGYVEAIMIFKEKHKND